MSSFDAINVEGIYRDHIANENEINSMKEELHTVKSDLNEIKNLLHKLVIDKES